MEDALGNNCFESRCHEEMHQAYVPKSQQFYVYYLTFHPTG